MKYENKNIRLYNGDCLDIIDSLIKMDTKVDLVITSPPYFNAREYISYQNIEEYMSIMNDIFTKCYKILNNHRYIVINIGDVICKESKAQWSKRKFPLAAYFTIMLEKIGFHYIDDYIWDKGEVESKRHLGNPPYPMYQYPLNCYEHILIFSKNILDKTKIPCPACNETIVVSNSQTSIGVQSWECKNPNCSSKSRTGRGKRFSERSILMNGMKKDENKIDNDTIKRFRRDIVKITPMIKINCNGENTLGHTAPFPVEIPDMAVKFFTGKNDIVLDPFAGSGTTGIVCKKLNRKFIGIELDENYFNIAKERIENSGMEKLPVLKKNELKKDKKIIKLLFEENKLALRRLERE